MENKLFKAGIVVMSVFTLLLHSSAVRAQALKPVPAGMVKIPGGRYTSF